MTTYAFPGYVGDVIALTGRVEASWGNAIRDRTNQVFATATGRDAAITSPQVGQVAVITTGANAGLYVYNGATVGWTPPWELGWGTVLQKTVSANQGTFNTPTDLTGLSGSWTVVTSRLYEITFFGQLESSAANDSGKLTLWSNTGSAALAYADVATTDANIPSSAHLRYLATGLSAGTYSIKMVGDVTASTSGNLTLVASSTQVSLVVKDIGPTGAPS